jgi:2'-5' RNA ligase
VITEDRSGGSTAEGDSQPARIFVAFKIASHIARELSEMVRSLQRLHARLVAPADIHLTLVPPWNETDIDSAVAILGKVAATAAPFTLAFVRLGYGPQPRRPRLLWAECAAGADLDTLRAALLRAFGQKDERPFRPHVTLARIPGNGAKVARKQPIDRPLALAQRVETVELMQSPRPGEIGYRLLASLPLGGARSLAQASDSR